MLLRTEKRVSNFSHSIDNIFFFVNGIECVVFLYLTYWLVVDATTAAIHSNTFHCCAATHRTEHVVGLLLSEFIYFIFSSTLVLSSTFHSHFIVANSENARDARMDVAR